MRAKYWPNAGRDAGSLELDSAIDAIRIGASECPEATHGRGLSQRLGTGNADAKGEVGVDVEVDHTGQSSFCSGDPS
jgi:hypothetical protein